MENGKWKINECFHEIKFERTNYIVGVGASTTLKQGDYEK